MIPLPRPRMAGLPRRQRSGRLLRDILLLPPALLFILVEHVFWAAAKAGLRAASRLSAVRILEARIRRLPPLAVLPLFLVPETISHVGGIWATLLLLDRRLLAAGLVGFFIKGFATLVTVWIYQNCEPALLRIGWFARLHARAMRLRDRLGRRVQRLRNSATELSRLGRSRVMRRFGALRRALAARFGLGRRGRHSR